MVDIWPIENYHNDIQLNNTKSALLVHALNYVCEKAQDYIASKDNHGAKACSTDNKITLQNFWKLLE